MSKSVQSGAFEAPDIEPDGYVGELSHVDEAWQTIGAIDMELEEKIKSLKKLDVNGGTTNRDEILDNESIAEIRDLLECIFGRLETLQKSEELSKLDIEVFDWGTIGPTFDAIIGDLKEYDVGDAIDAYQTISEYTQPFRADLHYGPED